MDIGGWRMEDGGWMMDDDVNCEEEWFHNRF